MENKEKIDSNNIEEQTNNDNTKNKELSKTKKNIIKGIIFVASAIIVAILLSFILKQVNKQTYKTDGSIDIDNKKESLVIGDKTITEILNSNTTNDYLDEDVNYINDTTTSNDIEDYEYSDPNFVEREDSYDYDDYDSEETTISSQEQTNQSSTQSAPSDIFNPDTKISDEVISSLEENGISEKDIYFLRDIVYITDKVVTNYNEILSYALSGDFTNGKTNLELLVENKKELNNLEVSDASLKKIKTYLVKGTQDYIDGFNDYFDYGNKSDDYFKSADTNFYNAQTLLRSYLDAVAPNVDLSLSNNQ